MGIIVPAMEEAGMAEGRHYFYGTRARRRHAGSRSGPLTIGAGLAFCLVAGLALQQFGASPWLLDRAPVLAATPLIPAQSFPACAGSHRVTCVVDGDTFWLDGEKYRIADINTPEISSPACAAEAALGRTATTRLGELLAAGPFTLAPADRDTDRYGRKLRVVLRDGQSIGGLLVAEGLAHPWQGQRESWC